MRTCTRCGGQLPDPTNNLYTRPMCDCDAPSGDRTAELPSSEGAFPVATGSVRLTRTEQAARILDSHDMTLEAHQLRCLAETCQCTECTEIVEW